MVELIIRVDLEIRKLGLTINKSKTKVIIVDRGNKLTQQETLKAFDIVNHFVYLGSMMSD